MLDHWSYFDYFLNVMPCLDCFMWPSYVEIDDMRYIFTWSTVIFGKFEEFLFDWRDSGRFCKSKTQSWYKLIISRFAFVASRMFYIGISPIYVIFYIFGVVDWFGTYNKNYQWFISAYDDFMFFRDINVFSHEFNYASDTKCFSKWHKFYIIYFQ